MESNSLKKTGYSQSSKGLKFFCTFKNFLNRTLKIFALFFIGSYRTFGTQFLGGNCRFIPSCSEFAKEAFNEHDFLCALKMTLGRLSKCHPLGSFGYDPVPERKRNARSATN